ncbi:MAG TPA: hypothetical protein VFJ62_14595, partial [Usitatibacter sp.]|nr:hypothetical protein [Usitatibacter sp.]
MRPRVRPLCCIAARTGAALAVALIAGCASAPEKKQANVEPLTCPPVVKPVCPSPTPVPPPAPEVRGKLVPAAWSELPDWGRDPLAPALQAFVRSCSVLEKREAWSNACGQA